MIQTLTGHTDTVRSLTVFPNGYLASGGDDYSIRIWNPATGQLFQNITGAAGGVWELRVLQNGNLAACTYVGAVIKIFG